MQVASRAMAKRGKKIFQSRELAVASDQFGKLRLGERSCFNKVSGARISSLK